MTAGFQVSTMGISMVSQREDHALSMATFKELREESGLTVLKLAQEANVSLSTVNRMEYGKGGKLTRRLAYQVLNVISGKIGRRVKLEEVDGLEKVLKESKPQESNEEK